MTWIWRDQSFGILPSKSKKREDCQQTVKILSTKCYISEPEHKDLVVLKQNPTLKK